MQRNDNSPHPWSWSMATRIGQLAARAQRIYMQPEPDCGLKTVYEILNSNLRSLKSEALLQYANLFEWFNQIGTQFYGPIEGFEAVFQQIKKSWNNSATRQLLQDRIRALIHTSSDCQIIKVICFGLGDISVRPPSWWRIKNRELENPDRDTVMVEASMLQHCAALTIVDALRQYYLEKENSSGNTTIIRLLTQDPKYTEQTRECLRANGFEVVGPAGAGGFAEVDNETVVFSAFATAPIKQIIADLARPVLFIGSFPLEDFDIRIKIGIQAYDNKTTYRKPSPDAESPRTREMWKSYAKSDFPVAGEEIPSMASLHKLSICARNAKVD
ncbi:hypothetical protein TruAng_002596 [Truncatella angustata]|nr:hypothetical protein TruAng_002596 [Truncatella angustata]